MYLISLLITIVVLIVLIFNKQILKTTDSKDVYEQSAAETETIKNTENIEDTEEIGDSEIIVETEENQESGETTTIIFAGDVLIAAAMEQYFDTEGINRIVSEELLAEMQNADICMVNNEFQFSNRGTPMEDKQFTFQTDPKYVQILLDMGVDIVSLANNHSLDFGKEALQDTFATLDEAGILYAGAGDTKERAEQLQIIEVNGQKIGFLAATRVIPVSEWNIEYGQPGLFAAYDDTRLTECIREAKEICDFLAVYVHWGIERESYPQKYQTTIAKNCFTAGADLVIGAHPHVLQGIEFMDGKPVFYSLGNYVFAQKIAKTALVKVEIQPNGEVSYRLIPAYAEGGKTQLLKDVEAEELFQYMNEISTGTMVDEFGTVYELQ